MCLPFFLAAMIPFYNKDVSDRLSASRPVLLLLFNGGAGWGGGSGEGGGGGTVEARRGEQADKQSDMAVGYGGHAA